MHVHQKMMLLFGAIAYLQRLIDIAHDVAIDVVLTASGESVIAIDLHTELGFRSLK